MWSSYRDEPFDPEAEPGLAPPMPAGLDPVELTVDGESWVVSRRAESRGTYDFDWVTHSRTYENSGEYGFALSASHEWRPDRAELTAEIRAFMAEVDPETGYLRD